MLFNDHVSASGGLHFPDPIPGLRHWTPLGDFRHQTPWQLSFHFAPNLCGLATPLITRVASFGEIGQKILQLIWNSVITC